MTAPQPRTKAGQDFHRSQHPVGRGKFHRKQDEACPLVDAILAIEAEAAAPLRAALEHYDERVDPDRSTGEMSAREWRDAYFTLARIALKELEQARAALAQPTETNDAS